MWVCNGSCGRGAWFAGVRAWSGGMFVLRVLGGAAGRSGGGSFLRGGRRTLVRMLCVPGKGPAPPFASSPSVGEVKAGAKATAEETQRSGKRLEVDGALTEERRKKWRARFADALRVSSSNLPAPAASKNADVNNEKALSRALSEFDFLTEAVRAHQEILRDNGIGVEVSGRERIRVNARRVGLEPPEYLDELPGGWSPQDIGEVTKRERKDRG